MDKSIVIVLFILLVVLEYTVLGINQTLYNSNNIRCECYVDSLNLNNNSSTTLNNCGKTLKTACLTIFESIQSCGNDYDTIMIYMVPGEYSIDNNQTFGSITNKTIIIQRVASSIYNYSNDDVNDVVVIDLSKSIEPFINIVPITENDQSNITITDINFIGFNSFSILSVNNKSLINSVISNCQFSNSSDASSSLFSFSDDIRNSIFSVINSTFSSINLRGGSSIISNGNNSILISFDQCNFNDISNTMNNDDEGAIASIKGGSYFSITNSIINGSNCNSCFYFTYPFKSISIFQNVNFINSQFGIMIKIESTLSFIKILNCNFKDNKNTIMISTFYSKHISIDACLFLNNSINSNSDDNNGSTIINTSSIMMSINNCSFIENYSESNNGGGAISLNSLILDTTSSTNISNTIFKNNLANINGGAISSTLNNLYLSNVQFDNNFANNLGDNIYCSESLIFMSNSSFINTIISPNDNNEFGFSCSDSLDCKIKDIITNKYIACSEKSNIPKEPKTHNFTTMEKILFSFSIIVFFIIIIIVFIVIIRLIKKNRIKRFKNEYTPLK